MDFFVDALPFFRYNAFILFNKSITKNLTMGKSNGRDRSREPAVGARPAGQSEEWHLGAAIFHKSGFA